VSVALTPANALWAACALTTYVWSRHQKSSNVTVDTRDFKRTYEMDKSKPYALAEGVSYGVLTACAFGWNPVVMGSIWGIHKLIQNEGYRFYGDIDYHIHPKAGDLVRYFIRKRVFNPSCQKCLCLLSTSHQPFVG
jgi:hypothetical protein